MFGSSSSIAIQCRDTIPPGGMGFGSADNDFIKGSKFILQL